MADEIPLRPFGRHDELVSALALGGYHIGTIKNQKDAIVLIHAAIDAGITFMSMMVLRQNLEVARGFQRMTRLEMAAHRKRLAERAADGRFETYKITAQHEGDEGRAQHEGMMITTITRTDS